MAQAVHLDSVSRSFGSGRSILPVLDNFTLLAEPGEIVAVLGPSGCGKSTILRLLGGLEVPAAGRVVVGDRLVTTTDDRCAVVFQEPRLLPWRTVADNVALGANRRRDRNDETGRDVIGRLLTRVGLTEFARAYPHQLSGGMAQRVALARALAAQPEVLLLDEPFAALDALTRLRMQDLLSEVWTDRKPTVVLVTHDVDEAIYLADRIVVLGGTRPSSIVAQVPVRIGRPRDHSGIEFAELRARILGHVGIGSAPDSAKGNPRYAASPPPAVANA